MCECHDQINALLAEKNVMIDTRMLVNMKTGVCRTSGPIVAVCKLDAARRGTKIPVLFCAHCPFCGEKYETDAPVDSDSLPPYTDRRGDEDRH